MNKNWSYAGAYAAVGKMSAAETRTGFLELSWVHWCLYSWVFVGFLQWYKNVITMS